MPTSFPMSNPWVDLESLNAAKLSARITTPINDLYALVNNPPRRGVRVQTNAAQALVANTLTLLNNNGTAAWTVVEDSDGFASAVGGTTTPIIIPAGLGGIYVVGVKYTQSVASTSRLLCTVRVNGTEQARHQGPLDAIVGGSSALTLAVGDQISVQAFTTTAANVSIGTQIYAYRNSS